MSGGAWKESVLFSFDNAVTGASPVGSLLFDTAGALYGALSMGPGVGRGVVYKLIPPAAPRQPWSEAALHRFADGDGNGPLGGLFFDTNGGLYGVTKGGGRFGAGVAVRLAPPITAGNPWTETMLHSFSGGRDGGVPSAPPFQDTTGSIYGGAGSGGLSDKGGVYRITPPATAGRAWSQAVLYSFHGPDGSRPNTVLSTDGSGEIYGATAAGGSRQAGSVFALRP
jgi:hypothetical protein